MFSRIVQAPVDFSPSFPTRAQLVRNSLASLPERSTTNKIKTYLPLTASIHSTDLLLLLGCYKTDARATTLISIHLLTAGE